MTETPTTHPSIEIVPATTAPRFELPGVQFVGGAAPSRGSADLCVWTVLVEPGHTSPDAHTLDRDEVFVVVAGTARLQDGTPPLVAGDTAVVPAGAPIQLANPGAETARLVAAIAAGFRARLADGTEVGTPPWAT